MTALVFTIAFVAIAAALSLTISIGWAVERHTANAGWIDTAWSFGVGGIAVAAALIPLGDQPNVARRCLVALAVAIWALRLGRHIAARTRADGDDQRYAELRRSFADQVSWRMWVLVQKQAMVSIPLVVAVMLAAHRPTQSLQLQDGAAAIVFLIALAGEALADRELRRFRQNAPPGSVCQTGLWRWSRHPNYFFEWMGWFTYPLIALDFSGHYQWGYLALAAPALMYWLLVHVSGIPPLEARMLRSRGEAFRDYQARTSSFFLLPSAQPRATRTS